MYLALYQERDMSLNSQENIIKVLTAFNPWWKSGAVRTEFSKTYKRFAFYETMKILSNQTIRRTVVLTGTRRVGKTTIQYQIIESLLKASLLKAGIHPHKNRICLVRPSAF